MSESEPSQGTSRARVLVGVDGSEDGLRAVRYAMREADVSGADLLIVHAIDEEAMAGGLLELLATPEGMEQLSKARIAQALEVVREAGFPSSRVRAVTRSGRPGAVLAELGEGAAAIVVGRRSMSGLERMFVGSTSLAIAATAKCPVIVVSAAASPGTTGEHKLVAVGLHSWPVNDRALEWGVREAELRGARLRVVHVVPETIGVEVGAFVAAATSDLEAHLGPLRERHPQADIEVAALLGNPVDDLVAVSKVADLLILGLHRGSAAMGGSVRGVLAHAHCPIGLVRAASEVGPRSREVAEAPA